MEDGKTEVGGQKSDCHSRSSILHPRPSFTLGGFECPDLTPWESNAEAAHSDRLKRFVHQDREEYFVNHLPRVIKPIPPQGTMNGHSSPHQTGDLLATTS
jgi:hypothetical protein